MEPDSKSVIHIEFFYEEECPYCSIVRKILLELLQSNIVGKFIIIEEIDINSLAGKRRMKIHSIKESPMIIIDGKVKIPGIPHPTLLFNEVLKIINTSPFPQPPKHSDLSPPELSKESKGDLPFYT